MEHLALFLRELFGLTKYSGYQAGLPSAVFCLPRSGVFS